MSDKISFCKIHPNEFLIAHFHWLTSTGSKEQDMCIVCGNEWWEENGKSAESLGLVISEFKRGEEK